MKYIVGLFLAFSLSFAHAQLYPIIENGVVLHMKESKFYPIKSEKLLRLGGGCKLS